LQVLSIYPDVHGTFLCLKVYQQERSLAIGSNRNQCFY
jgi:hypothetical protein